MNSDDFTFHKLDEEPQKKKHSSDKPNKLLIFFVALALVALFSGLYAYFNNKNESVMSEVFVSVMSFLVGCGLVWYLNKHY